MIDDKTLDEWERVIERIEKDSASTYDYFTLCAGFRNLIAEVRRLRDERDKMIACMNESSARLLALREK